MLPKCVVNNTTSKQNKQQQKGKSVDMDGVFKGVDCTVSCIFIY